MRKIWSWTPSRQDELRSLVRKGKTAHEIHQHFSGVTRISSDAIGYAIRRYTTTEERRKWKTDRAQASGASRRKSVSSHRQAADITTLPPGHPLTWGLIFSGSKVFAEPPAYPDVMNGLNGMRR